MFFGEEGYEVVAVGDGAAALRELEKSPAPDVLLADAVMPGPDGYELCGRVKSDARLRGMPVVLLVGTFEPFNEAEARRVGADTVLTKPFQSIRDLVSKVGSLLGGEPKHEDARAHDAHTHDERAAEARSSSSRADASRHVQDAREGEGAHGDASRGFGAAQPYADFGADDEMIEAVSADSLAPAPRAADDFSGEEGLSADSFARRWSDAGAARGHEAAGEFSAPGEKVSAPEEEFAVSAEEFSGAGDEFSAARFGARDFEPAGANGHAHAAYAPPTEHHEENPMPAQPSFDSRASAADDALLDLGQVEPHPAAASAAAEADDDDFILDLDDFAPPPPPSTSHGGSLGAAGTFGEAVLDEPAASDSRDAHAEPVQTFYAEAPQESYAEPARADAPSAFAEAAHGETHADVYGSSFSEEGFSDVSFSDSPEHFPAHAGSQSAGPSSFSESSEYFSHQAEPFGESAVPLAEEAGPSQPAFVESSSESSGSPAASTDLVMQDGPQGFASYASPQSVGSSPRGFIEPEVVQAEVPAPAAVEGEFEDGSVEGDLPRPPAEATAAGHTVLEGHTRVEEPASAGRLSQESIETIARRVVEMMSDKVVREIAWEVVPELAELLVKRRLEEDNKG
jgi:CheY-like chemotaxis protein